MTDIVERLRVHAQITTNLLTEVAEENERLRKENDLLRTGGCKEVHQDKLLLSKLVRQTVIDELERLRKENDLLRVGWCKEAEKRMADWANESNVT